MLNLLFCFMDVFFDLINIEFGKCGLELWNVSQLIDSPYLYNPF